MTPSQEFNERAPDPFVAARISDPKASPSRTFAVAGLLVALLAGCASTGTASTTAGT